MSNRNRWSIFFFLAWSTLLPLSCLAQVFATIRGTVVDPQEKVIQGAKVVLKAQLSSWTAEASTDEKGGFTMTAVPAGTYEIQIEHDNFKTMTKMVNVTIGSAPVLMFEMDLPTLVASTEVTAQLEITNPDASSPPVSVSVQDVQETPGANRSNSLAFITKFVPGAIMLHDHIHMRGGHQVSWLVDGIPIPNTNISSAITRQIDPKDIENVEISRGGYSAQYGDRIYGMINVVPRSGFEFDHREGELTVNYGSLNQTNDQLVLGGHSQRFAYYTSLTGSRTDLGLEPVSLTNLHNRANGIGLFTTLNFNATAHDLFRFAGSLRGDQYQIPNLPADQLLGIRDHDKERDGYLNATWVHSFGPTTLLTVSPFYHRSRGQYLGGPQNPLITTADRTSEYTGAQVNLGIVKSKHNIHVGTYGFYQNDDALFRVEEPARFLTATEKELFTGGIATAFVDDQYKVTPWWTINAGVRLTHFSGLVNENAATPRIGTTVQVPYLKWVARGFWGQYYQPPPLSTISGPLLQFALTQGFGFQAIRGERDQQHEFGLTIPFRAWILDLANFRTNARNFFDHDVLGNSNLSLPLTIQSVRVRGWEATLRSPLIYRRARLRVALSHQTVQGRGAITGGLTDFAPPATDYFYIDHDQRVTMVTGGDFTLPRNYWASANVEYGSGFLDGNGPAHLPQHATVDFSIGKKIGERWSLTLSAINIGDTRYLLGRDNAFAGTHWNDPRQIVAQLHYRFHY